MRVSSEQDDIGYKNWDTDKLYNVFLDGTKQIDVFTADDELGFILKAVQPIQFINDELVKEECYGVVKIEEIINLGETK